MRKVRSSLTKKYQDSFSFFRAKQINELIYGMGTKDQILYEDLVILDQESEFMRRMYQVKTLSGRNQIQQRIKMQDFYIEYTMLTYQVPFMFITNTKQLYLRRQKRFKQLRRQQMSQKNGNNQQQQQQGQNQQQQQGENQQQQGENQLKQQQKVKDIDLMNHQEEKRRYKGDYLCQLQLGLSQLMVDQSSYLNIQEQQMDQTVFDIYTGKDLIDGEEQLQRSQQKTLEFYNKNTTRQQHQTQHIISLTSPNVDHLICDFMQIDMDQAIQFYKQFIKTQKGSTIISQLLQQEIKLTHKNSQKNSLSNDNQTQNQKYNYYSQKTTADYSSNTTFGGGGQKMNNNYQIITKKDKIHNNNNINNKIPRIEINYASTPHPSPNNKPKLKAKSKPKNQQTQPSSTLIDKYLQKYKLTTSIENQQQQDYLIQQQKQQRNKIRQKAQKLLLKIKTQSSTIKSL